MERYPAGIAHKGFMQKDVSKGFPEWLERVAVPKKEGTTHYPLIQDLRALLWLANQNCITPHVWTSRVPTLEQPDLCVFDLDPAHDDPRELRAAALAVRGILRELGLISWVKTSGSKGFHIVVPLEPGTGFEASWRFAHGVGAVLVKRHPDMLTQEFLKADRQGRILVDTGRNGHGATFAAPYAVRPLPDAPLSLPCSWDELATGAAEPRSFTLRGAAKRLTELGDLWSDLAQHGQSLGAPLAQLDQLLDADDWQRAAAAATRKPGRKKAR
jgi:bifunctional non-homologous end joining protein LigD